MSVSPHYLAFVNRFGGGTERGHHAVVDSSYEWGQDLPAYEAWLAKLPQPRPAVHLAYFGNSTYRREIFEGVELLPSFFPLRAPRVYPLRPGYYVISATLLHTIYGRAFGPWRESYEARYQKLWDEIIHFSELSKDRAALDAFFRKEDPGIWREKIDDYDALRFARLCAYLRNKEPHERLGYGLLVYKLTSQEVEAALNSAVPSAPPGYIIKGADQFNDIELGFVR